MGITFIIIITIISILLLIIIYDRFFQRKNLVMANFPLVGRFRYFAHELRPFFRQYFGDDNSFSPRLIIEWILEVAKGKPGHFSFDKFDDSQKLHNGNYQMIHSNTPYNKDEMKPIFPIIGEKRKQPFQFQSYFYKSAMSLGAIGFEATKAMAQGCCDAKAPFNTGEGGFSVQHIPRVKFDYQKFFTYHTIPEFFKILYYILPGLRLKNRFVDFLAKFYCEKNKRDLYLFCHKNFLFYKINWEAPLKNFPTKLDDSFGHIIFQVGSGLYGLRKKTKSGNVELDFDRFKKIMSFSRACELKLAQGAKQSGGILKAIKNTPTIAEIRGVHPGIDLVAPNRFPYLKKGKISDFFDFIEKLSKESGSKPVGCKIVISDKSNIEPLSKELKKTNGKKGPDFITIDGGDGGSGTAPISMGIMYGKTIIPALKIVNESLNKYNVRKFVKVFASSKLYSPHMSARGLAYGADAIGNARSIMISAGCIRAALCSGEKGNCPVGLATMEKKNRRGFEQTIEKKSENVKNYIEAHNKELILVSGIAGVDSPSKLGMEHIMKLRSEI